MHQPAYFLTADFAILFPETGKQFLSFLIHRALALKLQNIQIASYNNKANWLFNTPFNLLDACIENPINLCTEITI